MQALTRRTARAVPPRDPTRGDDPVPLGYIIVEFKVSASCFLLSRASLPSSWRTAPASWAIGGGGFSSRARCRQRPHRSLLTPRMRIPPLLTNALPPNVHGERRAGFRAAARPCCWATNLARCGTSSILRLQPTAVAYFLSDAIDGACFPAASRRDTALLVVPMRVATASCVKPARLRADSIWRASAYSTASPS